MNNVSVPTPSLCAFAKWAFTTRRVKRTDVCELTADISLAARGDLILCEIAEIGHHKSIKLADRQNSASYSGDLVVLCCGDRSSPGANRASAVMEGRMFDLAAGDGIAVRMNPRNARFGKPTRLRALGLLTGKQGEAINIAHYALPSLPPNEETTVIGVIGASVYSGNATAAADLARGISRAGYDVVRIKTTGMNVFDDCGVSALDFTDVGIATTHWMPMECIESGFDTLVATAAAGGANVVVAEIAEGVFQQRTRGILQSSNVRNRMDGLLFAAPDTLSAYGGAKIFEGVDLRPFAITGTLGLSASAKAEAAEVTGLPILFREDLLTRKFIDLHVAPFLRNMRKRSMAA